MTERCSWQVSPSTAKDVLGCCHQLVDVKIHEPFGHSTGRMPSVNHVLCGLAANTALPSKLVDRLIAVADAHIAAELACRADLSHDQAVVLVSRVKESAVRLVYEGRLTAADIDPAAQPRAALALLDALSSCSPMPTGRWWKRRPPSRRCRLP